MTKNKNKGKVDNKHRNIDGMIERYGDLTKPGAYSSPYKLSKITKKSEKLIRTQLLKDPTYYLHRKVKDNFLRRRVIVSQPFMQYAIDLKDVREYKIKNKNVGYLLCMVDCFSRFAYCEPIVNKKAETSEKALKKILSRLPPGCRKIQSDRGGEFFNKRFQALLKSKNITLFATFDYVTKASIVERFQKTLMRMIHRFMERNDTDVYIDSLQDIVGNYNRTFHKAIQMAPVEVSMKNKGEVTDHLFNRDYYTKKTKKPSILSAPKFNPGDTVVVSKLKKGPFTKEYKGTFRPEIFEIHKLVNSDPYVYKVRKFFTYNLNIA